MGRMALGLVCLLVCLLCSLLHTMQYELRWSSDFLSGRVYVIVSHWQRVLAGLRPVNPGALGPAACLAQALSQD